MSDKVALVTGANRGIGFSIVRKLCNRGVKHVYLASRDVTRGREALTALEKEGLTPLFIHLDVTDAATVKTAAEHLKSKHGGLDILIHNAGVVSSNFNVETYDEAKRVIDINYRSAFIIQEYLFPILKANARVVNISSDCGHISNLKNKYWIERLTKDDLKIDDIEQFVSWYLDNVKNGTVKNEDFAESSILSYRVSKIALVALTRIQQRNVSNGVSINAMHPGLVRTDMTGGSGFLSADEASETPVYLALDAPQTLKGQYIWFDQTVKDWTNAADDLYFRINTLSTYSTTEQQV